MLDRIRKGSLVRRLVPLMLVFSLVLVGCSGSGSGEIDIDLGNDGNTEVEAEGFIAGLVDGFIAPFTFIASLFDNDVDVYDDNASDGYGIGFVLGLILILMLLFGLFAGPRYYRRR